MRMESARNFVDRPELWFIVCELMGNNLEAFHYGDECEKFRGRGLDVIKQVARDILSALKSLHNVKIHGKSLIHMDIKPANIVMSISKAKLFSDLKELIDSEESINQLRMVCEQDKKFDEMKAKSEIKRWMETLRDSEKTEVADEPRFKLIDFGSAKVSLGTLNLGID